MAKRSATARHIKATEIVKVAALLNEHVEKLPNGLVQYKDNWNDDKIAKVIAADLSPNSVARLRQEFCGNLVIKGGGSDDERFAALERRLEAALDAHASLLELHAKLCDNLSLNRIVDVRHLRGKPSPIQDGK